MDTQIRKNEIWSIGERLEDWEFDLVIKFINMDKKNKIMLYASVLSDDEELGEVINSGGYGAICSIYRVSNGQRKELQDVVKIVCVMYDPRDMEKDEKRGGETYKEAFEKKWNRVISEGEIQNRLSYNDHILKNYGYSRTIDYKEGHVNGRIFLIRMHKYMSLDMYVRKKYKETGMHMDEFEIVKVGENISSAMCAMEENDFIHRDIKDRNVFVSEENPEKKNYMLGDFGAVEYHTVGTVQGVYLGEQWEVPEISYEYNHEKKVYRYSSNYSGEGCYSTEYTFQSDQYLFCCMLLGLGGKNKELSTAYQIQAYSKDKKEVVINPFESTKLTEIIQKGWSVVPEHRYETNKKLHEEFLKLEQNLDVCKTGFVVYRKCIENGKEFFKEETIEIISENIGNNSKKNTISFPDSKIFNINIRVLLKNGETFEKRVRFEKTDNGQDDLSDVRVKRYRQYLKFYLSKTDEENEMPAAIVNLLDLRVDAKKVECDWHIQPDKSNVIGDDNDRKSKENNLKNNDRSNKTINNSIKELITSEEIRHKNIIEKNELAYDKYWKHLYHKKDELFSLGLVLIIASIFCLALGYNDIWGVVEKNNNFYDSIVWIANGKVGQIILATAIAAIVFIIVQRVIYSRQKTRYWSKKWDNERARNNLISNLKERDNYDKTKSAADDLFRTLEKEGDRLERKSGILTKIIYTYLSIIAVIGYYELIVCVNININNKWLGNLVYIGFILVGALVFELLKATLLIFIKSGANSVQADKKREELEFEMQQWNNIEKAISSNKSTK